MASGKIGVSTKDLFPIIKKFLYSDHDIFLREIISNAVDASQKLKTLGISGEFKGDVSNLKVNVKVDKEAGTLTVSDNGIGMTMEEVDKYINQIAFSGAEEFLEKHKEDAATIIGHFGLGFYSAFMVSDKVEIITKSYKEDSKAVKWSCEGETEYTLEEVEKAEVGSDIIMHITDENKEFLEDNKINELLIKYCKFLPIEIVFGKKKEWKDGKDVETSEDNIINNVNPAWTRKPADLKEEDYKNFYHELYPMAEDPLFHIHLNVDYPFNLTGILYFPKISNQFEIQKNKIQLYCNQVFVTDQVEGIVPEYLTLLHGVIDSPDIPLNVSRSYLQSDRNVKKISNHITKKVADSLMDIFKTHREDYESKWEDLKVFIQYGILSDEKFGERAKDIVLLEDTDKKFFTLDEYEKLVKDNQTDKDKNIIYLYTTDVAEQYTYIEAAKAKGYNVLVMNGQLDTHFVGWVEQKNANHKFARVDSDVIDNIINKEDIKKTTLSETEQDEMKVVFNAMLPKKGYMVNFEALGEEAEPVVITRSEFMRRMKEMSKINPGMGFYGQMDDQMTLVVNTDHKLVKGILDDQKAKIGSEIKPIEEEIADTIVKNTEINTLNKDKKDEEIPQVDKDRKVENDKHIDELKKNRDSILENYAKDNKIVSQLIDLGLLANGLLKGEALNKFVKRSVDLIK